MTEPAEPTTPGSPETRCHVPAEVNAPTRWTYDRMLGEWHYRAAVRLRRGEALATADPEGYLARALADLGRSVWPLRQRSQARETRLARWARDQIQWRELARWILNDEARWLEAHGRGG